MSTPPSSSPLRLPKDFRYECVQCGRSCSSIGEVAVDHESEERLNQLDLETLLPSEDRRPPVVDSPTIPGRRILKPVRGHCCFLSLQKKCLIHQRYDKQTKPQACQDFPFQFVETPGGDFVGLSFACTAVLEQSGPFVEEQQEQLEAARKRTINRRTISLPIRLADRIPLTWEQYERIEADLLDILEVETQPIENRLIAQSLYLRLLEDFVRETNKQGLVTPLPAEPVSAPGTPTTPPFSTHVTSPLPSKATAPTPNPKAAETANEDRTTREGVGGVTVAPSPNIDQDPEGPRVSPERPNPGKTDRSQPPLSASLEGVLPSLAMTDELYRTFRNQMGKDTWNRLFAMAFKRLEQPLLMRTFLGQIMTFRQTLKKEKRGRLSTISLFIGTYIRQAFRMGSLFLYPLQRAVEWKEIAKIQVDFSDPYFAYTVKRFFAHSIFRKDLLLESNLRLAHGFQLMHFGLWRYYISAIAALEGLEKAERRHLLEALFNVEKLYVFHPAFTTLFSRHPWWRANVESVMNTPAFPATMTRAAL